VFPRSGPGATAAVRLDEVSVATGTRIHYAESGEAGGEPVLFLHGYADSWLSWSPILERLPETIHAFAPSQRGHGDSNRPDCCYGISDFVADAVAFLDAVGIERASLVGHSMGALVAQRMATEHPRRVRRLVLLGAYAQGSSAVFLDLADLVEGLADPVPEAFVRDYQLSTLHTPLPAFALEAVVAESRKLPSRLWREVLAELLDADLRDGLSRIQAPTLILWGVQDLIVDRAEQQLLWASIPQATLRLYSDTGHALHRERPDVFVRHLEAFLE